MRLIDKDAILHDLENGVYPASMTYTLAVDIAKGLIEVASEIDAVPVVRGEWVKSDDYKGWLVCSACRDCYVDNAWVNGKKWRYCPNCGAKMVSGEN